MSSHGLVVKWPVVSLLTQATVRRETWVQFQQGAETLWSSWAIVWHIIKVGSAYICKICHYIDSCIFSAYFLHIFCIFGILKSMLWPIFCLFDAYFMHILGRLCKWFAYVLHVSAYFEYILCIFGMLKST